MAVVNEQLQVVQLGEESTWGTAVAQTVKMAGKATFKPIPDVAVEAWAEMGYLVETDSYINKVSGTGTLEGIPTYEQLHYLLDGAFGAATPSGAGPYTRVYDAPLTANPTDHAFYTIASGDSSAAYALVGALLKKLMISAKRGDNSKLSADFVGRRVESDTIDSLSKPTATYIRSSDAAISLCAIGGSHTAITCAPLEIKLECDNGLTMHQGMGTLENCAYDYVDAPSHKLNLIARADNATIATLAKWALGSAPAETYQEIRVVFTSGSQSLQVDFIGRLESSPDLRQFENGRGIFDLPFVAKFDASANLTTTALRITLINNTA